MVRLNACNIQVCLYIYIYIIMVNVKHDRDSIKIFANIVKSHFYMKY